MATRPAPAPFKATVRNDRVVMNIQGTIRIGITQSFYMIDDEKQRTAIIEELQTIDAKLRAGPPR